MAILIGATSHAKLIEEVIKVPVVVKNNYGKEVAQDIVVTAYYESTAPKPYSILVPGHGRASEAASRAAMGRVKYSANSRWHTQLGFMVAVPTRVGYGQSGGEDVEDTGDCKRKNYPPGYTAAAEQNLKVLDVMRLPQDTAKDKAIVMGQSFGGTIAITTAALNPPGVQATINFLEAVAATLTRILKSPAHPHCWNACLVTMAKPHEFQRYGSTRKMICFSAPDYLKNGLKLLGPLAELTNTCCFHLILKMVMVCLAKRQKSGGHVCLNFCEPMGTL